MTYLQKDENTAKAKSSSSSSSTCVTTQLLSSNNDKAGVIYTKPDHHTEQHDGNDDAVVNNNNKRGKRLILIRHGSSLANESLYRPGNQWGDATFTDDISLVDATLSPRGIRQAESLCKNLKHRFVMPIEINNNNNDSTKIYKGDQDVIEMNHELLVVTSPLTRCIETMNIGVLPNLLSSSERNDHDASIHADNDDADRKHRDFTIDQLKHVKIIVQPLATERVYTASDTGRPISTIENKYPYLDFDSCVNPKEKNVWWYTTEKNCDTDYKEWRPFGDGQYYAVPGEPDDRFNERMVKLFHWIESRNEKTIVLVCHWGVINWLTGDEVENCAVKELMFDHLALKDEMVNL